MKVNCAECGKKQVGVDKGGFIKTHRKSYNGPLCNGSGRHINFNR